MEYKVNMGFKEHRLILSLLGEHINECKNNMRRIMSLDVENSEDIDSKIETYNAYYESMKTANIIYDRLVECIEYERGSIDEEA